MARAATTSDAFNAVAEPQRRRILTLLKGRERSVNELAGALRVSQTRVSKHLRVLREVGLVSVREAGQQRFYRLDARGLKPIHDWVGGFEEFWSQSFDRLNAYVKRLQRKEGGEMMVVGSTSATSDREIVVTRIIEGPRPLVFEAYTDPGHLAQWWGPNGFTTTTRAFEFRPGGVWDFVMHGPDGTDYPNWIEWREIEPPERLVFLHGDRPDDPRAFVSTVTLVERGGATEVTMRAVFKTKAQRDEVVERYHAIEGGKQTLGRLALYVATLIRKGR